MKLKEIIGVDVSKLTIDVCVHSTQDYSKFENSLKGFSLMVKWVNKTSSFSIDESLYVFEHTGLYSYQLSAYLTDKAIAFSMIPGLAVKRSLGITRGKDDKVDALKLALYGYRLREEIIPYTLPTEQLLTIKRLLSLRERLVKQRSGYKASFKEQKRVLVKGNKLLLNSQKRMITSLTKEIKLIEKEMDALVKADERLNKLYQLIISVKGIGSQTALFLLAYTNGFTKFKDARSFASYCGIAPFPNVSGTSVRGRTKVSNLANKKIKSLLDLCAKSAIQHSFEIKTYYEKRVAEGKNKMSTINIIRNKLLYRVFAVVKRNTPYVDVLKYAG